MIEVEERKKCWCRLSAKTKISYIAEDRSRVPGLGRATEVGAGNVFIVLVLLLVWLFLVLGLGLVACWGLLLLLLLLILGLGVRIVVGAAVTPRHLLVALGLFVVVHVGAVARACTSMVNERVLQRTLGRLVQLVVELCLCVRVLIV